MQKYGMFLKAQNHFHFFYTNDNPGKLGGKILYKTNNQSDKCKLWDFLKVENCQGNRIKISCANSFFVISININLVFLGNIATLFHV